MPMLFRLFVLLVAGCSMSNGVADLAFGRSSSIFLDGGGAGGRHVAVGDVNADGKLDVVVANSDSRNVSVFLALEAGDLRLSSGYSVVGSYPTSLALADVNDDGKLDIVVAAGPALTILLGDGRGLFKAATYSPFTLRSRVISADVGDLDVDGHVDLVITTSDSGLYTALGTGFGFAEPVRVDTVPGLPSALAIADFDGDGRPDLVVGNSTSTDFYMGRANGFEHRRDLTILWPYAGSIAVGDLNGDGLLDLAVSKGNEEFLSPLGVLVFLATRNGPFVLGPHVPAPDEGRIVTMGDVNGDGKLDVVAVGGAFGHDCFIYLGDGRGGLAATVGSPLTITHTGEFAYRVVLGDLTNDGSLDIVAVSDGRLFLFAGDRAGGFQPAPGSPFAITLYPAALAVGDLDGDGRADIATVNHDGSVSLLMGREGGTLERGAQSPIRVVPGGRSDGGGVIVVTDVNGDGRPDLVLRRTVSEPAYAVLGDGRGGFTVARATSPVLDSGFFRCGDVNGDGKADIVAPGAQKLTVYIGRGDGSFQRPLDLPLTASPRAVELVDVNRDGQLDIVALLESGGLVVRLGDGAGAFDQGPAPPTVSDPALSVVSGDVTGDGIVDLVLPSYLRSSVQTLLGSGTGTFRVGPRTSVVHGVGSYAVARALFDVDGDGILDFVIETDPYFSSAYSNAVRIFQGDGRAGFHEAQGSPFRLNTRFVAFVDVTGDGFVDAVGIGDGGTVVVTPQVRIAIAPATLPNAVTGTSVTRLLSASGGTAPYTFRVSNGLPPFGLSLSSAGVLSGTPLMAGTFELTVTALDATGVSGQAVYRVTVTAGASSSVGLVAMPNPSTNGVVTLSASVGGGAPPPSGSVVFRDGSVPIGSAQLTGSIAVLGVSLAPGNHVLTAFYPGDQTYREATSAPIDVVVNGAAPSPLIVLETIPSPSVLGQPVVLTARVSGTDRPSGSITFLDGASVLAIGQIDATGEARLTTTGLSVGTHALGATYSGDASHGAATAAAVSQLVTTLGGCASGGDDLLCVLARRFLVRVDWTNPYDGGSTGSGRAQALTDSTGTFWFFTRSNVELAVKILDGRSSNGSFWVAYGALTDVQYGVTVFDSLTGRQRTYFNPPRKLESVIDLNAFPEASQP